MRRACVAGMAGQQREALTGRAVLGRDEARVGKGAQVLVKVLRKKRGGVEGVTARVGVGTVSRHESGCHEAWWTPALGWAYGEHW